MRNQLLVRIDVATALHCRRLCRADSLGISDQDDGERTGREFPQYCKVKVRQREARQTGREIADDAYPCGFTMEEADEDCGHDSDYQGRRYARHQAAQE
jgi:hypothetical protein